MKTTSLMGLWSGEAPLPPEQIENLFQLRKKLFADQPTKVIQNTHLWLCNRPQNFHLHGDKVLSTEGFVSGRDPFSQRLEQMSTAFARYPFNSNALHQLLDGHYVCVYAETHPQSISQNRLLLLRQFTGGEHLYYVPTPFGILFASSLPLLLSNKNINRRYDHLSLIDTLLNGQIAFSNDSLIQNIKEVPPGCVLDCCGDKRKIQFFNTSIFIPPVGQRKVLAKDFRQVLTEGIENSLGNDRPVPILLSGGIDSSAVAAMIVDIVGSKNVLALSYEFDDPNHKCETVYSKMVCQRLGIKQRVFKLSYSDYIASVSEAVYRNESPVCWYKAFFLSVIRQVVSFGIRRAFTGFGFGSHMQQIEEFSLLLDRVNDKQLNQIFGYWRKNRLSKRHFGNWLKMIHPGIEAPNPKMYGLIMSLLYHRGRIKDLGHIYPTQMGALTQHLEALIARSSFKNFDHLPFNKALQYQVFMRLLSCVDTTRWEKPARELGLWDISPAHFAKCIPYAYLPLHPRPRLYSEARDLRPGKLLLREAMRDTLPKAVLYRKKSWFDAIISPEWRLAAQSEMLSLSPELGGFLGENRSKYQDAIYFWEAYSGGSARSLGVWHEQFMTQEKRTVWPKLSETY